MKLESFLTTEYKDDKAFIEGIGRDSEDKGEIWNEQSSDYWS